MSKVEVKVPNIGDYKDVPVIELLVQPGDRVVVDQGLVSLESDKATMEVPSSVAGKVLALRVKVGDSIGEGAVVAEIETEAEEASAKPAKSDAEPPASESSRAPAKAKADSGPTTPVAPKSSEVSSGDVDLRCQLLVLGAGPGGYTAAFRAADLGLDVILIERYPVLGGVCLNVGCIPSKALLHAAEVIDEAAYFGDIGIEFGAPKIDLDKLRSFKSKVVSQLNGGLAGMAKQRKIRTVHGHGRFLDPHTVEVTGDDGKQRIGFEQAIIAVGSQAVKLPGFPWDDKRVMDSTDALELAEVPKRMLVVGGGIIGLEMAQVYAALGSQITVVELLDQLMPGADKDVVKPLEKRIGKRYAGIHLKTKVTAIEAGKKSLVASFEGEGAPAKAEFDRVLVAVGRSPNGGRIDAQAAGVAVSDRGYISVDEQMRTNVPHIFAIGDVVGQPMLAHKATHEGKVAAEVAAGQKSSFVARVIPSVAYTDPEIAWVGLTETEAKAKGIAYGKGVFPHAASGRAIGIGRTEGFTKLLFDEETHRVIGGAVVCPHAGDLIAEIALAIEMGCDAADIALTIHPHPTLSETVNFAAEVYEGTVTDLYLPRKKQG
jgi:dihydrolipoamide dehydrogenase